MMVMMMMQRDDDDEMQRGQLCPTSLSLLLHSLKWHA